MNSNSKINILIVGAMGKLGTAVTKHCLAQPNLSVNILVRNPERNKELADQVIQAGGKVIKGDVTQPETLKGTTKGMHTVIMTFDSVDSNVAVDGQIAVINDCLENKVERVVPAEYSTNPDKFSRGELEENSIIFNKIKIQEYLKTVPIKHLNVNTGIIVDWFLEAVVPKGFDYWGDVHTKLQLTSYDDTGKVIAAAVARKDLTGDVIYVSDDVSTQELAEIYNKVRGTDLKPNKLGSLGDMLAKAEELEKQGNPDGFWLKLNKFIYDERTRFERNDNEKFGEVKRTTVEEFFKQKPEVKIGA